MRELKSEGVNYRLLETLGVGQSATVFKAVREDPKGHSRQTVALKLFHSASSVSWLRREFETLACVNSRYCVRLLALESLEGRDALVLELVDGVSLYELARSVDLSDEIVGEAVAQVQEGLRALAICGLHHGDLSPKNILVGRDGYIRLIDFATDGDGSCERGTPRYMAPELWDGGATGLEADLFALGLIALDAKNGFGLRVADAQPVDHQEACRIRAQNLASDHDDGLLARFPARRRMLAIESNDRTRAELSELVEDLLTHRRHLADTALIAVPASAAMSSAPSRVRRLHRVTCYAFSIAAAVSLPARLKPSPFSVERAGATLAVRSQFWLKIALNGRDAGYAPLEIKELSPGSHRLSWQGQAGGGEISLDLAPGERRMLTEKDLLKQGAVKRR